MCVVCFLFRVFVRDVYFYRVYVIDVGEFLCVFGVRG